MYLAITDIDIDKSLLISLVNDENRSSSEINLSNTNDACAKRINKSITDAGNEIDSYLTGKYVLPIVEVPAQLKLIAADIAIYNLYKRRTREDIPDSISGIYNARIKQLKEISDGKIDLGIQRAGSSDGVNIIVNKTADDRIFTQEKLDSFI